MKLAVGFLAALEVANAQYKPKKWHSKWIKKSAKNPMKAFARMTTAEEQSPCENATLTFVEENPIDNGFWNCPSMEEAQSEISCFGKCNEGFEEEWKRALVIVQCKNPPNTKNKVKGSLICSQPSTAGEKCTDAENDFIAQNPIENGHFECADDAETGGRKCEATCDDSSAQSRWKSGSFIVLCGEKIKIKSKLKGELACQSSSSGDLCKAALDNGDFSIPSGSLDFTHEKKGTSNYEVKCDDGQVMGTAQCKDGKFFSKKLADFPDSCSSSSFCTEEVAYNITDIGDGYWQCKNKQPNELYCKGKCNQDKQKIRYGLRCTGKGWEFVDKQFLGDRCEGESTTGSPGTTDSPSPITCSADAALEEYPLGDGKWICKERKKGLICNGQCDDKGKKIRFNVGCWEDKGWSITKDPDFSDDVCSDTDPETTTTLPTTTKDSETSTSIITTSTTTSPPPMPCTEKVAADLFDIGFGSWHCHVKGKDKFMCKGKCENDDEEIRYKIACDDLSGWRISKNHEFSDDKCSESIPTTTEAPTTTTKTTTSTITSTSTTSTTTTTTSTEEATTEAPTTSGGLTTTTATTTSYTLSTTGYDEDTTTTPLTTTKYDYTTYSGSTTETTSTTASTTSGGSTTTSALATTESTTSAATGTSSTQPTPNPNVRRFRGRNFGYNRPTYSYRYRGY